ncbi:hypothetical protein F53441_3281 [Fusarium austroafricanum]|uniref:Catalase core domain-containing protein n=1 Tax=Fusarium austroafricanum TaxID=2364996 RepID=A0A8H4KPG8_9HYPO|nr:hypothetical protein F53441_3281 [Fusarium austroafricanum]
MSAQVMLPNASDNTIASSTSDRTPKPTVNGSSGNAVPSKDQLPKDFVNAMQAIFGKHPGYRTTHAKGLLVEGTFTPSEEAKKLSTAAHFNNCSTKVIARFSVGGGLPHVVDVADGAAPKGVAIRFQIDENTHTDLISHSFNSFATCNGEGFLTFLKLYGADGFTEAMLKKAKAGGGGYSKEQKAYDQAHAAFLSFLKDPEHKSAAVFVSSEKPNPHNYGTMTYYEPNTHVLTNKDGKVTNVRYRLDPADGEHLYPNKTPEDKEKLAKLGPDDILDDATKPYQSKTFIPVGKLEINKVSDDNAAKQQQIAFSPNQEKGGIQGIKSSSDPLIQARKGFIGLVQTSDDMRSKWTKPPNGAAQFDAQSGETGEIIVSKPLKKRRVAVKVACTRCHQRKSQYGEKNQELQREPKTVTALIDRLRGSSEEEALAVVRRLKTTTDVSGLLASISEPAPIQQQSSHQCALGTLPPTQSFVEYELTILHSFCYPALEPIELPKIDLDCFSNSNWSTLTRPTDDKVFSNMDNMPGDLETVIPSQLNATAETAFHGSPRSPSLITSPSPRLRWCDPRLNQFDINYWTKVPISNEFAAGAISTYLETDHALLGFFDADLFLSDLVEQRLNYCSPFLVSSLLCMACVSEVHLSNDLLSDALWKLSYNGINEKAPALSHVFQHEAEQLWYAYRGSDNITTLSAIALCLIACIWLGKDKLGKDLLKDSRAMAERL